VGYTGTKMRFEGFSVGVTPFEVEKLNYLQEVVILGVV